jgi:uncharacterized protein with gpF-like domain
VVSKFLKMLQGERRKLGSWENPHYGIPTVKFDRSRVTDTVRADIRECIESLPDIDKRHFAEIYDAALSSFLRGRDIHVLYNALINSGIDGVTKNRARQIALYVDNRATSLMDKERQESLGFKYGVWRSSGAPCMVNAKEPNLHDIEQAKAHVAADGKLFEIGKGMLLNGRWTWPGREEGCKCIWTVVMPGATK